MLVVMIQPYFDFYFVVGPVDIAILSTSSSSTRPIGAGRQTDEVTAIIASR